MNKEEKHIINRIKDHREELDLDMLWQDVESDLPKKRRRPVAWFFLFMGVLALFAIIGVSSSSNTIDQVSKPTMATSINNVTPQMVADVAIAKNQKPSGLQEKDEQLENSEIQDEGLPSKAELESRTTIDDQKRNTNSPTDLNRTTNIYEVPNEPIQQNIKTTLVSNAVPDVRSSLGRQVSDEKVAELGNAKVQRITLDFAYLSMPYSLVQSIKSQSLDINEYQPEVEMPKPFTPHRWSLKICAFGGYASQSFSSSTNESSAELNRRLSTEDGLGVYGVVGKVGYELGYGLRISSGIQWTQLLSKAEYSNTYQVEDAETMTSTTFFQDGMQSETSETTTEITTRTTFETRYNRNTLISIPLELTYNVISKNGLSLDVVGGVSYGVFQSARGFISRFANAPSYDLNLDSEDLIRRNGSLGYRFGLILEKPILPNAKAMIGVSYNSLSSLTTEKYLIDHKYNFITFNVGVRHRL